MRTPITRKLSVSVFATVFLCGLTVANTLAQEPSPSGPKPASDIRDTASMFGAEAVTKARANLARIEREFHVPVLIETVESLRGAPIEQAAQTNARSSGREGIYILIAQKESKIETLISRRFRRVLDQADSRAITDAIVKEFRDRRFDDGLARGVAQVETLLAKAKSEGRVAAPLGQLVFRDQVRLTLGGARKILEGAEAKAAAMNLKVNIAVVDDGGHMIAFARMDGARPASGYTATTKAVTAATFRQPTGPVPTGTTAPDPLLNIGLQNAAAASGGKLTTLYGGVPVVVEGQVIGGVGVGGGSGEQDAAIARAGIETLLNELGGP